MGRFEDYPGLVGTGVQLLENRLRAISQGFESLSLRQWESRSNPRFLFVCVKGVAGLIVETQKIEPKTTYLTQPRGYHGYYKKKE